MFQCLLIGLKGLITSSFLLWLYSLSPFFLNIPKNPFLADFLRASSSVSGPPLALTLADLDFLRLSYKSDISSVEKPIIF